MKSKSALVLVVLSALFGCQQPAPQAADASPIGAETSRSPSAASADFELRDFAVEKETRSYGGASYTGRGTLVSRDARLSEGSFFVFLTAKQEHEADGSTDTQVLLKDGIGQVRVGTYQTEEEEKTEKVRYYDWEVLGYIPLSPGSLKTPAAKPATAPSNG